MIHRLYSDLPSFKSQGFRPGLNLLVCERGAKASERQTRNRAGKTSLVEIVHFLLGANVEKQVFKKEVLERYFFGMELDLGACKVTVERSGSSPNSVRVTGPFEGWPVTPATQSDKSRTLTLSQWKEVLGSLVFGLPSAVGKNGPTFRSLFPYFARSENAGGFFSFDAHSKLQQTGDKQVALSYLLGLDWTIPQRLEGLRDDEKGMKTLRQVLKGGSIAARLVPSSAPLRTQLAVAERRVEELRAALAEFHVHEQYKELEKRASELTQRILDLADANTLDLQMLSELDAAIESEVLPPTEDLQAVYREIDIELPVLVARRFEDVRKFHESLLSNRKAHLQARRGELEGNISSRNAGKAELDRERSEVMRILSSHGALEHFEALGSQLGQEAARLEELRSKFTAAAELEAAQAHLASERVRLHERLLQDFREQDEVLNEAIGAFEEFSHRLYEEAGSLQIDHTENGPKFEVTIQGQRSKGVKNMQIFCFDLMLMRLCSARQIGPGFLIHDSHLFDGVDSRQTARALTLAAQAAERYGFQYLVTLNSDTLEADDVRRNLPEGFVDRYGIKTRMSDATEDGGLFGIRF